MYLIFGTEQQIEELRGKAGKALVHMIFKVICQKSRLRFFTKQFLFNKKKYCLILNKAKQKIVNIISFFLLCIYLQLWNFRPYEDYPYFRNIQKFIHIGLSIQIWIIYTLSVEKVLPLTERTECLLFISRQDSLCILWV